LGVLARRRHHRRRRRIRGNLPSSAETAFATIQGAIIRTFSWYYVLIAAFFVAFALVLGFSRFGEIKLGKDDDEPEFSLGAWFSLLFAAGMGIGLVFYGVSEPLSHHAVTPRPGVTGYRRAAGAERAYPDLPALGCAGVGDLRRDRRRPRLRDPPSAPSDLHPLGAGGPAMRMGGGPARLRLIEALHAASTP
jgi:hypothetical protein